MAEANEKVTMVLLDDEDQIVVYVGDTHPQPKHYITRLGQGRTYWEMIDITPKGSKFRLNGTLDRMYEELKKLYKKKG